MIRFRVTHDSWLVFASITLHLRSKQKVCSNELTGHWQKEMWERAQKNAMAWKKSIIFEFSHDTVCLSISSLDDSPRFSPPFFLLYLFQILRSLPDMTRHFCKALFSREEELNNNFFCRIVLFDCLLNSDYLYGCFSNSNYKLFLLEIW